MSEHIKDRTIRVEDIPLDATVLLEQGTKPYASFIGMFVFSAFLIYIPQSRVAGVLLAAGLALLAFYTKNVKLLKITDEFIVSYERKDQSRARIIYYDEIAKWEMRKASGASGDVIILYLTDGSLEGIPVLYLGAAANALRKTIPDKEDRLDKRIAESRNKLKRGK